MRQLRCETAALVAADGAVLVGFRPNFAVLTRDVRAPHEWLARAGADRAVASLATAGLWLVAVWVAVGLLCVTATRLPGAAGRAAAGLSRVLVPALVRRAIAGSAGLGVLLTPVVTEAGHATSVTEPRAGTVACLAREATADPSPLPAPIWPTRTAPTSLPAPSWPDTPTVPRRGMTSTPGEQRVRIERGDSLWLLAARRLGRHPRPQQIADAWPRWYSANRAAIGPNPDHLVPGTVLRVPPPDPQEAP